MNPPVEGTLFGEFVAGVLSIVVVVGLVWLVGWLLRRLGCDPTEDVSPVSHRPVTGAGSSPPPPRPTPGFGDSP